MKQILLAGLFFLAPGLGHAATYYVAANGSNGYTCAQAQSVSTPKLTIAAGLSCLSSADTLMIKAGTYPEFIDYNQIPAGTASARTTVQGVAGETVILKPTTGGRAGNAVWLDRSYITLSGLVVDAAKTTSYGIRINNGASYLIIRNMEVKNAPGNCIGIQTTESTDVQIINSKVHDCGTTKLDHGVYLRGSNHLVERNEIYNNVGHGVHQWNKKKPANNNNIIRYNYVHNNRSTGILIGSGNSNQAYGNIVGNNRTSGIVVGYNSANNSLVYDNTIYSNGGNCIFIRTDSTNSRINNNICWQNGRDAVRDDGSLSSVANTRVAKPTTGTTGASDFRPQFSK
jgi:Right handed beta helix region